MRFPRSCKRRGCSCIGGCSTYCKLKTYPLSLTCRTGTVVPRSPGLASCLPAGRHPVFPQADNRSPRRAVQASHLFNLYNKEEPSYEVQTDSESEPEQP